MKLEGKVAVVTGAGAGIGRVYAQALSKEGVAVVIADLDTAAGQRVAGEIGDEGGDAIATVTDVSDEAQVQAMSAEAVRAFGGIDILVNNAGLHLMQYTVPPTQLGLAKWRDLLDVNLTGPLMCASACQPSMKERGGGIIVNQSSIAAYTAVNAYGVSKLALNGLTMALATEFAPDNIRVHGVAPGITESEALLKEMPEERRLAEVEQRLIKRPNQMSDLAGLLIFLCSDESRMITGQTWIIDGGTTRRI
jgi:NAD(P)-dependent dehydrogenase (short-subunit alcohol dehydrogenase family)